MVDALPETVWKLAGSPAALSACPAWIAFEVPGKVPGTDRLCCMLVSGEGTFHGPVVDSGNVSCVVIDVREEVPGQMISWQLRDTKPAEEQVFTLSVRPQSGKCAIRIAVTDDTASLSSKSQRRSIWRHRVKVWLDALQAVAEGKAPWPQTAVPAAVQRALTVPPPLLDPVEASAATVINASPGDVWEALWDPASLRLISPELVAWSGQVPGTPQREAGEMQYFVQRHADGRFTACVGIVTELTDGHRAVIREIGSPRAGETVHVITPVPGGTRLELTSRTESAHFGAFDLQDLAEMHRQDAQLTVEGYQELIEGIPGSGGQSRGREQRPPG